MYISLKALTCSALGTLLLLSLLSDAPVAHARSLSQRRETISTSKLVAAVAAVDKRDLLGEIIPVSKNGDPSSPAPAPAAPAPAPVPAAPAPANPPSTPAPSSPPPAPAPEKKDPEPVSEPATSPQKEQGGSGFVEQLLGGSSESDPQKHESSPSSPTSPATSSTPPPATSAEQKKKPTQGAGTTGGSGNSRTDDDSSSSSNGGNTLTTSGRNGGQDQDPATSGVNSNNKNATTTPKEGLSSGIIAMIVLVVLGVLATILLSCYRIRQSRVRRKEREDCWDENILKNHVGAVGYNGRTNGSISGGSNGVGSIDVKSEALGDGGCHGATIEAAYAGRGSLGGSSLRDTQSVGGGSNVYGGGGGTYSPYSQHAHTYSQGYSQQQQQQQVYGGGGYSGTYY